MPISRVEEKTCTICGKRQRVRLGDVLKPEDLRPFICDKCKKKMLFPR